MARRRRHNTGSTVTAQDPGKDLFAYLFLLMMVFFFMMLMSMGKSRQAKAVEPGLVKQAQDRAAPVQTTFAQVGRRQVGRLVRRDGRLFLVFGKVFYRPREDFAQLTRDGRVVNHGKKRTIYLAEEGAGRVLLAEYLETFQFLNVKGVDIAFAEVEDE